jgi:uncharacterized membrane protein YjfL (UPF0719 family)
MACILSLMGSVLGFVLAMAALVLFQVPLITAFLIWSATGIACLALGLALATIAAPPRADIASQELA